VKIQNLITNRNSLKNYYATSPNASLKSIAHSKADEIFLEKLNEIIQVNLSDSEFGIDQIAEKVNMSRPTLFRKIKAISDLKPNELINVARIKKAAELLSEEKYKVYEVSFMVGFNSSTVFSRVFQRHFSISPTEYLNKQWKSNRG
jgi:AraC-like DNA-binding protein